MVCAPVQRDNPRAKARGLSLRTGAQTLKLGDYLSVQAHKSCSISHRVLSLQGGGDALL